jgi:hypothetical protein
LDFQFEIKSSNSLGGKGILSHGIKGYVTLVIAVETTLVSHAMEPVSILGDSM